MSHARLMQVGITPELLHGFAVQGNILACTVTQGAPETARLDRTYYDAERDLVVLVLEDESFPPLEEGQPIPRLDVILSQDAEHEALRARLAAAEAERDALRAKWESVPWKAIAEAFGNFFGEAWADEGEPIDTIDKWLTAHYPVVVLKERTDAQSN